MSREQSIIERAGGEYLGLAEGLIWFNDPRTHTTMTVDRLWLAVLGDQAAIEDLKLQIASKRAAFAQGEVRFKIQNSKSKAN